MLAAFTPRYPELKAEMSTLLRTLAKEVDQREAARQSTSDARIRALREVLAHPEREATAEKQNPSSTNPSRI